MPVYWLLLQPEIYLEGYVGGLSAKASLCNFYVKKSYSQFSRNKADFCSALPAAAAWCHRDTTSAVGGILK